MLNNTTLSAIITIIYITAVTIIAELFPPLKEFLNNTFSHHWIGKSITAIGVFLLFALLFSIYQPKIKSDLLMRLLSLISLLGMLILLGFFTWESSR